MGPYYELVITFGVFLHSTRAVLVEQLDETSLPQLLFWQSFFEVVYSLPYVMLNPPLIPAYKPNAFLAILAFSLLSFGFGIISIEMIGAGPYAMVISLKTFSMSLILCRPCIVAFVICAILCCAGIVLVQQVESLNTILDKVPGCFLALLVVFFMSGTIVIQRAYQFTPPSILFWTRLVILFIFTFYFGLSPDSILPPLKELGPIALIAFLQINSFMAHYWAFSKLSPLSSAFLSNLAPAFTFVAFVVSFGEDVSDLQWLGVAINIISCSMYPFLTRKTDNNGDGWILSPRRQVIQGDTIFTPPIFSTMSRSFSMSIDSDGTEL